MHRKLNVEFNNSFEFFSWSTAVFHAMACDGSSGGVCRIGIITKDGIVRNTYFAQPEAVSSTVPVVPSVSGVRA